jgi:cell division protease FtsH
MEKNMDTGNKRSLSKKPPVNWGYLLWFLLGWLVLIYLFRGFTPGGSAPQTISYTEFKDQVRENKVAQIVMKGNEISGRYRIRQSQAQSTGEAQAQSTSGSQAQNTSKEQSRPRAFKTTKPSIADPDLLSLLQKHQVAIYAEPQRRSWLVTLIITLLPWVLIIGAFYYISKRVQSRMGGPGGGILGFGKSKAKLYDKSKTETTFDNVAGLDNAKKELQEIIEYLKDPSRFKKLGAQLPKGILLIGPPGVGKTLLAQGAAGEADVPFYSISGSEFIEMFVGVGASRVRDMFDKARKDAPAIIFIDEIDSIGRVRGTGLGGGHDEREQTLNQILAEMDGFSPQESVVVMAATNRPDVLDPALVRPGRFDRQITLELPQRKARHEILKIHSRDVPLADDVNLAELAEKTVGMSGAELKNLVNEATLIAARRNKDRVESEDLDQARDKILMGIRREDVIEDDEKNLIAYHEAGHALLAELLPEADPLEKVTIIPRGRALGATEQIPEEDRHNLKRAYLLGRIAIMLGGRAAEKIQFNDLSTGAGDDLKKATQLARRMVCQWGMSDRIGPVTFRQGEPHPFLGRELTEPKDFSEETARLIDEEIERIIRDMEKKAEETISANKVALDLLAGELLKHETLSREEVAKIMDQAQTAN